MNSRSGVNETNLVNFSTELTTLNQLDTKDGLLSFPFDHIYACHSNTPERRALQLEKEVEIATHCVVPEEKASIVTGDVSQLTTKLAVAECQNKRLKDLLIYHLDLIQQQNDLISKREKIYNALKQENDSLKCILNERKPPANQRHSLNQPLVRQLNPTSTVTSTVVSGDAEVASQVNQIMLNSFTELLLPDNTANSYLFDGDLSKPKPYAPEPFELSRSKTTDVTNFASPETIAPPVDPSRDKFNMIENKRAYVKKEMKQEPRTEALYTVTSNSGNPVIQRIQRNRRKPSAGIGSLSRMTKTTVKVEPPEVGQAFKETKPLERTYSLNKKPKMISTYGKARGGGVKKTTQFTGSLSDRLQLIDTTPTGEDPYQLGEADMREQSPIPKLMLQKTNHGGMKIGAVTGRRIYDAPATETGKTKVKMDRYSLPSVFTPLNKGVLGGREGGRSKTVIVHEPDLSLVKTEPEIDWRTYEHQGTTNPRTETSLCDFSYGETSNNLATGILPSLDSVDFQDLFNTDGLNLDSLNPVMFNPKVPERPRKRGGRTTSASLLHANLPPTLETHDHHLGLGVVSTAAATCTMTMATTTATTTGVSTAEALIAPPGEIPRGGDSKRGRKRAHSTTGLAKMAKPKPPPKPKMPRGKAACRGKRSPVPGRVTRRPYHTQVGDPDLSWYLGLDPDLKPDDVDPPPDCKRPTVEVPRWREKPYTSCYTMEGTENVDDRVYEKRHQKLEAEERRQLRWHMRRIREQRHVERLRQRQRVGWCARPAVFSVWPRPQRDVRFIEITDTLPVIAFGEPMPDLPAKDFMLPWVRTSKALKRSKRSKTLH